MGLHQRAICGSCFVSRSELAFTQLLDEARLLTERLGALCKRTAILPPEAAPLEVIPTLTPWFAAQYLAGLELLRSPTLAPAADSVLRGLVELFAAVAWISDGGAGEKRFSSPSRG